ncbi:MAG: hypothetical protein WA705_10270 [Candidatus Ozemobacteraceae bacterium]
MRNILIVVLLFDLGLLLPFSTIAAPKNSDVEYFKDLSAGGVGNVGQANSASAAVETDRMSV